MGILSLAAVGGLIMAAAVGSVAALGAKPLFLVAALLLGGLGWLSLLASVRSMRELRRSRLLGAARTWSVQVTAQVAGLPEATATFPVTVLPVFAPGHRGSPR